MGEYQDRQEPAPFSSTVQLTLCTARFYFCRHIKWKTFLGCEQACTVAKTGQGNAGSVTVDLLSPELVFRAGMKPAIHRDLYSDHPNIDVLLRCHVANKLPKYMEIESWKGS